MCTHSHIHTCTILACDVFSDAGQERIEGGKSAISVLGGSLGLMLMFCDTDRSWIFLWLKELPTNLPLSACHVFFRGGNVSVPFSINDRLLGENGYVTVPFSIAHCSFSYQGCSKTVKMRRGVAITSVYCTLVH